MCIFYLSSPSCIILVELPHVTIRNLEICLYSFEVNDAFWITPTISRADDFAVCQIFTLYDEGFCQTKICCLQKTFIFYIWF